MSKQEKRDERSESQARAQFESIKEMVAALNPVECESCSNFHPQDFKGDCRDDEHSFPTEEAAREKAEQTIHEDPLSVEVRSGWYTPDAPQEEQEPTEYCILLCTGGPACRIVGDLDRGQPSTARIEHQDWGTPWTEYRLDSDEEEIVLQYAHCFYFGD